MSVKTARRVSPAGRLLQMGDKISEILRLSRKNFKFSLQCRL